MRPTLEERFWAKVDKRGPCWLWTGATWPNGYGAFKVNGQNEYAHRVSYRLAFGPIPEGHEVDHVKANGCTHRACVNPAHLEAVVPLVNILRSNCLGAINARKTHCLRGHALTGNNLRVTNAGSRQCRTCDRQRQRDRACRQRFSPAITTARVETSY